MLKSMLKKIFCVMMLFLVSASVLCAADWTVFHGPQGDNKSPDTGLLKKWSEGGPKLLWTADTIGTGFSSVSVAGGKIYTSGNIQRDGKDFSMVFCLDLSGNLLWSKENGPAHVDRRKYPGTRGTPTVDGNLLFDVSPLGQVTCYDLTKEGNVIWSKNLLQDYEAPMPQWILGHSIVIEGDHAICMVGGAKALAVALNKKTGEPVTLYPPATENSPASYASPYLFDFEGTRVLLLHSKISAEGYDVKTGKPLFSIPWRNRTTTNITQSIYREGHLFMSSGYGFGAKGFKLTKNADGTIHPEELWFTQPFDNHHGGLVLVDDYVYGTTSRGNWGAIHFLTGKVGYLARPVGEEGAVHFADGLIYGLSYDSRTVFLWEPKPTEFVELGRFTLPQEASGKTWAHPVVINSRLYLRHDKYLYCYDVKAE